MIFLLNKGLDAIKYIFTKVWHRS